MSSETPQVEVRHLADRSRFEALVGGEHAGYAVYVERPGVRVFTHTEVDDAFEGQGVAGELARAALDTTRTEGLKVEPQCPFIRAWIERHPDYQDLVTTS
jgi:predicted GNAT family acetyltransferase